MWMSVVFIGMAAFFFAWAAMALHQQRWMRQLPALSSLPHPADDPGEIRCSAIVAVRNDEGRLETAIRSLLDQRHVTLEVIVVDDRSTDRTAEILGRLALEDQRLRVTRVERLPDGWLGKCHACHLGASMATGEWLLFTDADCWLAPDLLARALRLAARDAAGHVTLTQGGLARSVASRACHLAFLGTVTGWIAGVNQDRPGCHFGMAAFNLVKTSAYHACGGYEALRLTLVDDVRLGLLLQRAGIRTRAFLGGSDVESDWGITVGNLIRVTEKNYFAAVGFRVAPVVAGAVMVTSSVAIGVYGVWTGTAAGIVAGLSPWALALPAYVLARRLRWSVASAAVTPLCYPVLFLAAVNSAVVTLRQGGVRWRETFYPLDMLRRGNVE